MERFKTASTMQGQREFRSALSQFATGVAVITARGEAGAPIGMTMSSFNSVSLDTPLVLFSVDRRALSLPAMQAAEGYVHFDWQSVADGVWVGISKPGSYQTGNTVIISLPGQGSMVVDSQLAPYMGQEIVEKQGGTAGLALVAAAVAGAVEVGVDGVAKVAAVQALEQVAQIVVIAVGDDRVPFQKHPKLVVRAQVLVRHHLIGYSRMRFFVRNVQRELPLYVLCTIHELL